MPEMDAVTKKDARQPRAVKATMVDVYEILGRRPVTLQVIKEVSMMETSEETIT